MFAGGTIGQAFRAGAFAGASAYVFASIGGSGLQWGEKALLSGIAGPKIIDTAFDAENTAIVAMSMFATIVLGFIAKPLRYRFKAANVVSITAIRTATSPPYNNIASMINPSEIVTCMFTRGSWIRS